MVEIRRGWYARETWPCGARVRGCSGTGRVARVHNPTCEKKKWGLASSRWADVKGRGVAVLLKPRGRGRPSRGGRYVLLPFPRATSRLPSHLCLVPRATSHSTWAVPRPASGVTCLPGLCLARLGTRHRFSSMGIAPAKSVSGTVSKARHPLRPRTFSMGTKNEEK